MPLVEFPLRSFRSVPNVWSSIGSLRRYVAHHGIRVVHAFDPPSSLFVGLAAGALGRVTALTSQRSFRQTLPRPLRAGLKLADRFADGIVVNCEAVRRQLVAVERVPVARVHVCYNGLDACRFRPRAGRPADVAPPGALVVGTLCNLRPEKDLPTLLKAVAACRASHPELFLLVVGDGPVRAALEAEAQRLGLAGHCRFQPAAADVVPWLQAMDVFVLPSVFEALSNALMEAMACERACIASNVGGNPELVRHGETGLLFERGDAEALAAQILTLVRAPELRRTLGCRAGAAIRQEFTLRGAADRLGAIYQRYLAGGAA